MEKHEFIIDFERITSRADRAKLESPLEEFFIHHLEKYISYRAEIVPQYQVSTIAGTFRLDFLLKIGEKKIGIECDGKDFHNEWKDEWRDALILGSGTIETIYRFRGKDIHTFIDDCIFLIYYYDNELFSDRYPVIAEKLISIEIQTKLREDSFSIRERNLIEYKFFNEESGLQVGRMELLVERRSKQEPGHWQSLYKFANEHRGASIDELIDLRNKENDQYFKKISRQK